MELALQHTRASEERMTPDQWVLVLTWRGAVVCVLSSVPLLVAGSSWARGCSAG